MAIVFRCEKCDARYRVQVDKAGCAAICQHCGQQLTVPHPQANDPLPSLPILRSQKVPSVPLPPADVGRMRRIADHVEAHLGPIDYVFQEQNSEYVHIEIFRVPPQKHRPYYSLVTCGMSEKPMTVPTGEEALRYAELMLCLPPNWPLKVEDIQDPRYYWPIRLLKVLARLPHEFQTWLGISHSIPNGDPPQAYAANTQFQCALLVPPVTCDDAFRRCPLDQDELVHFYAVLPLYPEEQECKLRKGISALIDRLDRSQVTEVINPQRKNSCRRRWFPF